MKFLLPMFTCLLFVSAVHAAPPGADGAEGDCRITGNLMFDERGAVVVDYGGKLGIQYNPVTISQVAMACYYEYQVSGNPRHRDVFLAQIKWLRTNFVQIAESHAAYEYHFSWSYGLKPGWHSGLAQGQAMAALIFYYRDSNDNSVLRLIRMLKNFMLLPKVDGGLVVHTPEGGLWIEEFPSTPPSYVLNGFVSAILGLHEYTRLFPDDKQASDAYQASLDSIKRSLPAYDSGTWTYLDRYQEPKPRANDAYQAAHIEQMQSLADLSGDRFFDYMSLRWQSFLRDVNLRAQGNMTQTEGGIFRAEKEIRPIMPVNELRGNVESAVSTPTMEGHGIDALFDGDLSTYFAQDMDIPPEQDPSFIRLRMKTTVRANMLTVGLYNPELYPEDLAIFIKGENEQEFKEVTYTRAVSRRYLAYYFDVSEVRELRVLSKHPHGQNRLVIGELALGMSDWNHPADPDFGSYLSDVFEMSAPKFGLRLEAAGAETRDIVVIYRHGSDGRSLTQNPWKLDFIEPLSVNARPVEDRFYQFKVLAKGSALKNGWKNLQVTGGISLTERTGVGR